MNRRNSAKDLVEQEHCAPDIAAVITSPEPVLEHNPLSPPQIQNQTTSVANVASVPDRGLRAWLQVLGAFFLFFNGFRILNTFGTYQTFYETGRLFASTPSNISWIGSIQGFLLTFVGPLAGPLYDAGYFRLLILLGSLLVVFGQMMLSLSHTYWSVLLTQGFCVGIGAGCLFLPSVAILSTYFDKKLATATGLAATGSSLGGIVYPVILSCLLPRICFAWSTRVLGFMTLITLGISNLVMKTRVLPAEKRHIVDLSAFSEVPYSLFTIGCFFGWTGLYVPYFYAESYGLYYNPGASSIVYTLPIINAGSVLGRLLPNYIADRTGPMNIMTPATIISGILALCLIPARSVTSLMILNVLYGIGSGALVSLFSTVYIRLSTHKRGMIGTRMGMGLFFCSLGILLGTPISGWLLAASNWDIVWTFSGLTLFVGGLFMGLARISKARGLGMLAKV